MLGFDGLLKWKKAGDTIEIEMPKANPSKMPCEFAWTFKIDGIQK